MDPTDCELTPWTVGQCSATCDDSDDGSASTGSGFYRNGVQKLTRQILQNSSPGGLGVAC